MTSEAQSSSFGEKAGDLSLNDPSKVAVELYVNAVNLEQEGKLGNALDAYRRAFKLDSDVEFAYKRRIECKASHSGHRHSIKATSLEQTATSNDHSSNVYQNPVDFLIQQFSTENYQCKPMLDYKPLYIAALPDEVIVNILQQLAVKCLSSVAKCALTCKKFFLLSRSPILWQFACEYMFKTPDMTLQQSKRMQVEQVKNFDGQWLRMLIERPRIRYDGVYISKCTYIRPGSSETSWNQIIHVVTYYRYLRFFPNGNVLQHVTTDEPAAIVKSLVPGFAKRQAFSGRFKVDKDIIYVKMHDHTIPHEDFRLIVVMNSARLGRNDKLDWKKYSSISLRNQGNRQETHNHDLKHMKPFFFSVVNNFQVHPEETSAPQSAP